MQHNRHQPRPGPVVLKGPPTFEPPFAPACRTEQESLLPSSAAAARKAWFEISVLTPDLDGVELRNFRANDETTAVGNIRTYPRQGWCFERRNSHPRNDD